jgi:hypothetical protein
MRWTLGLGTGDIVLVFFIVSFSLLLGYIIPELREKGSRKIIYFHLLIG